MPLFFESGFLIGHEKTRPGADASMRPARLRVQINRRISAIPSRYALLTNPPTSSTSSPQGELRNTSRNSAGFLHVYLRLLFASRKCKTFAVLLVPTELPHRSLIFAPRGGFAAFFCERVSCSLWTNSYLSLTRFARRSTLHSSHFIVTIIAR